MALARLRGSRPLLCTYAEVFFFFYIRFLPLMQSALLQQMMERGGGGDGRCEKQEDAPPQSEPSETA